MSLGGRETKCERGVPGGNNESAERVTCRSRKELLAETRGMNVEGV
jgi:hypothetical protein